MSQVFKTNIDKNVFISFIKLYSTSEKLNEYIFTQTSYKKAEYNNKISDIIEYLKKYYHTSKQFYLNRQKTYKHFLTILRQVCNHVHIPYTSKILYNKSKYNIIYTMYINVDEED